MRACSSHFPQTLIPLTPGFLAEGFCYPSAKNPLNEIGGEFERREELQTLPSSQKNFQHSHYAMPIINTIIAIDPGKDKCGIAVVDRAMGILCKAVVPRLKLLETIEDLRRRFMVQRIVLGDRTGAKELSVELAVAGAQSDVIFVDEHLSTQLAKKRFFEDNPPKGLRKLVPRAFLQPWRPFDDYVAVILAERFFAENKC